MLRDKLLLKELSALSVIYATTQSIEAYKVLKEFYTDSTNYLESRNKKIITIATDDNLFWKFSQYIREHMVGDVKKKNLRSGPTGFGVNFRTADTFLVSINGTTISAAVVEDARPQGTSREDVVTSTSSKYLEFYCKNDIEAKVVEDWLEDIRERSFSKKVDPSIFISDTWSDWERFGTIPNRDLDTVALKEGQLDRLQKDINLFSESEELYLKNGLPYHRGYLFHGPPGTGKTSLIITLARHFRKHVCFLTPSDLKTEKSINNLFGYVPENAFVVLEDVDTSFAVQDRDANDSTEKERHLLSLMLNALDGITTPHGMILFMTTNKLDVIDPAIIRPGRVDVKEHFGNLDTYQLNQMVSRFIGDEFVYPDDIEPLQIAPATVSELFKAHLTNPTDAVPAVNELIHSRSKSIIELV